MWLVKKTVGIFDEICMNVNNYKVCLVIVIIFSTTCHIILLDVCCNISG